MQTIDINIETLVAWGEPKRVGTRNGVKILRKAVPTDAFWTAWRMGKSALCAVGIGIGTDKRTGQWEVCHWGALPPEEIHQAEARIEASKAKDLTGVAIPCPEGLAYAGYQKAGISFAYQLYKGGKRGCLIADEMGLGKTIQAIGLINWDPSIKTAVIVCPATLKLNWSRELRRWLTRAFSIGIVEAGKRWPDTDICILNYDIVHRFEDQLSKPWDIVIADEIHKCKNPKSLRAKALFGYKPTKKEIEKGATVYSGVNCSKRLALTGTAICNKPMEIFPVLNWLDSEKWSSGFKFGLRYADGKQTRFGWDFSGASNLPELQRELRSTVMVRREKSEVLKELPAKRRQVIEIPLDDTIRALVSQEQSQFKKWEDELADLKARVEISKASDDKAEYKAAVAALGEGTTAAFTEGAELAHRIALAKVPYVVEHVKEALEQHPKAIIFAHHTDVIAALAKEFDNPAIVTGDVDNTIRIINGKETSKRIQQADKFQTDPTCRVFLGNGAAQEGLTLIAANLVVFAELDWVPGNMSQREDRAHRYGQKDFVLVQHLVLEDSLDVHKAHTLIRKQEIISAAMDDPIAKLEAGQPICPIVSISIQETKGGQTEKRTVTAIEVTQKEIKAEAANITEDQRREIHTGIKMLSGVCNGATSWDGAGFNKIDTHIGKRLASLGWITPSQAAIGQKLVRKYQRQLPSDLVERCGVTPKEKNEE